MGDLFDFRQRTVWTLLSLFALLSGGITYLTTASLAQGGMTLNLLLYGILTLPLLLAILLALGLTGIWVLLAVLSFLQRRVALWGLAIFCTLKSVVYAFLLWIVVRFAHGLSPASQTTLAQRFPHYHETPYWLGLVVVVYGSVAIALWRVLLTRRLAVNVNEMWN